MTDKKYLDYNGLRTYNTQIKNWVSEQIAVAVRDSMHIKSTIDKAEDIPVSPNIGDVYISTAFFDYFDSPIEPGDLFVYTRAGWTIVQGNIDVNTFENMIPTKVSDLDNDSNFLSEEDIDNISDSDINTLFGI